MARSLTSVASTYATMQTGAQPVWILEIQWASGTVYYAKEALSTPVTASGKVVDFGEYEMQAEPGKAAQQSNLTLKLEDSDLSLKTLIQTSPGVQSQEAYVHVWFRGTDWSDRTTIFGGVLTTPMRYDAHTSTWTITARGFDHYLNTSIGALLGRQNFPEVSCSDCEGAIIPIVYGRPVYRVPACVIDRPGAAILTSQLDFCDGTGFTINQTASSAGFPDGELITCVLGYAGNREIVTGSFSGPNSTYFQIATRGAYAATGNIAGFFGSGGHQYVLIPGQDFSDYTASPPSAASRAGHPICLQEQDGSWTTLMVSQWKFEGDNVLVLYKADLDIVTGSAYKVGAVAGVAPIWRAGTPFQQDSAWTYAVNHLPSEEIERVEAMANVNVPGGGQEKLWARYNPTYYSVTLNNKTYNTPLGRDAADDGITTVTLSKPPSLLGFQTETIWVTLKGIASGGTALSDPADIINHLLTNEFLGNIDASLVDSSSFTTAASEITTSMSFALMEKRELQELVTELAYQGTAVVFWDQGKISIRKIDTTLSAGDSQGTFTFSNIMRGTLSSEEVTVRDYTNHMTGRFKYAVPAPEGKLTRKSTDAIDSYGEKKDELDLWAYQFPTSVALVTEFWLLYRLLRNRVFEFETFLNALHVQPGDTITITVMNGAGATVFNTLARVIAVKHKNGSTKSGEMETIKIQAEASLFSWDIETDVPTDESCEAVMFNGDRPAQYRQKVYVRSDGRKSMYVIDSMAYLMPGGGNNVFDPVNTPGYDVSAGLVVPDGTPPYHLPPPTDEGTGTITYPSGSPPVESGTTTIGVPAASISPSVGDSGTCEIDTTAVSDAFTDTNGTVLPDHTPDTDIEGGGWLSPVADIGIQSNAATSTSSTSNLIDGGSGNGRITVDVTLDYDAVNDESGKALIRFRSESDLRPCWFVRLSEADDVELVFLPESPGSAEVKATGGSITTDTTYTVQITFCENDIEVRIDDSVVIGNYTITDPDEKLEANTHVGLSITAAPLEQSAAVHFDGFLYEV